MLDFSECMTDSGVGYFVNLFGNFIQCQNRSDCLSARLWIESFPDAYLGHAMHRSS